MLRIIHEHPNFIVSNGRMEDPESERCFVCGIGLSYEDSMPLYITGIDLFSGIYDDIGIICYYTTVCAKCYSKIYRWN